MKLQPLPYSNIDLKDEILTKKRDTNREYLMRLESHKLLINFRLEAGLPINLDDENDRSYGGWEQQICQLRGHFLGHWLSAAAMKYAATNDTELKAKADNIVSVLGLCQKENGGEWCGSIPEKYLFRIAEGKAVWAPQYTIHKTMMGLLDMYHYAGNEQAKDIVVNWAKWFTRWSAQFTREKFDNILDVETGGMLEIWADLYGITGDPEHKALVDRYYRARLFEPLLEGGDPLTNMHANTTIPEVLGAARAYEVTGDQKWMDIVLKYWDCAVTNRGTYATGGQTCGEVWTPMQELAARLGDKNQEHCTVYNMMRLAEFLLRWTGDAKYADYWEQNLYNGIMAQGYWEGKFTHGAKTPYPTTGLLTYFLPLKGGSVKGWATEDNDFFCCHGTLVQANATHERGMYYTDDAGLSICQYFDSDVSFDWNGNGVNLIQRIDPLTGSLHMSSDSTAWHRINDMAREVKHDPHKLAVRLWVKTAAPVDFELRVRIPGWIQGNAVVKINGETVDVKATPSSFVTLKRIWNDDEIYLEFKKAIVAVPLPDQKDSVAFVDGPVVLAGLCAEDRQLIADPAHPEAIIVSDNEREWGAWKHTYRAVNQPFGIRFIPLYEVGYDPYTIYFQIVSK